MLRSLWILACLMLWGITPAPLAAQRDLHWDALEVEARLDSGGTLEVVERHTMVFTGDWNGGERIFNLRPRQKIEFIGMQRIDAKTGAEIPLRPASVPRAVDEFAWTDARTLRWRSRLPSDPPFSNTTLIYDLHYKLSGILLKDDQGYRIDHDFAFPNRAGSIGRFDLLLSLDPAWQPLVTIQDRYTAGPLLPKQSFVLTIPLKYSGTVEPAAIDGRRPKEIVPAVAAIFGGFFLLVLGFFKRERSLGRFADIDSNVVDRVWIQQHILTYPPEVVGMVWDGRLGTPEVIALIARMTAEGKLESEVGGKDTMTLRLKVKRETLDGYERALVDGLFFDERTETTTADVKKHYQNSGFSPAQTIKPGLSKTVKAVIPQGKEHVNHLVSVALFLAAAGLFVWSASLDPRLVGFALIGLFTIAVVSAILQIPGWIFRTRIDWDERAAWRLMIPAFLVCLGAAAFLWFAGGQIEIPVPMIGAIVAWALCIASTSINGMKSRQTFEAISFRKRLSACRTFFMNELNQTRPKLQDDWYPWLLAFGLGKQVDVWSSRSAASSNTDSYYSPGNFNSTSTSSTSSTGSSSGASWTGGGGLSGGAGATGAWTAAAAGMAAGVSAPSSGDSGGGGSSGGGSSGGGGGGGW